jgi:hypothetical protein
MEHIGRAWVARLFEGGRLLRLRAVVAVFVGVACASMVAGAAPTSWLIRGELLEVDGSSVPAGINAGDPFSVILHFDTSTPVTNAVACGTGGIGTRCNHNGAPVASQYYSDIRLGSFSKASFMATDPSGNIIVVRNNILAPEPGSTDIVDGYSFGSTADYGGGAGAFANVILRGPEDLNVVTDGRVLPFDPPPGLLSLGLRVFQVCETSSSTSLGCDALFLSGRIDSISRVPEPGSLALVAAGMALLTPTLRRRQSA